MVLSVQGLVLSNFIFSGYNNKNYTITFILFKII